jgi:hypothetical protein
MSLQNAEDETEEDLIIENLVLEKISQYEDPEFLPYRASLYEIESIVADYDHGIHSLQENIHILL